MPSGAVASLLLFIKLHMWLLQLLVLLQDRMLLLLAVASVVGDGIYGLMTQTNP